MNNPFAQRTQEEMTEVLMDPSAVGPGVHYYMIRGGSERGNITVLESGTVGGEYIKTYGHYHVDNFIETYKVLSGEAILLLQVRKKFKDKPVDNEVEYVKAIFMKAGSTFAIPAYAGHLLVNIGSSWLVTADDSPVNFNKDREAAWPTHADYSPVKRMQGFAYFVVAADGMPTFVKNPAYKNTPDIIIER